MSLIVTGSIGIDTVHTPTDSAENVLGGSCTYFCAAASFFTKVRMVAVAGDDFTDDYKSVFEKFPNVCVEGLEIRRKHIREALDQGGPQSGFDRIDSQFRQARRRLGCQPRRQGLLARVRSQANRAMLQHRPRSTSLGVSDEFLSPNADFVPGRLDRKSVV